MAGKLNIPKFVDFRNKVMRHKTLKFPVLSLTGKTTIAIHHSLTKQGLGGSNAEGYARFHVQTNGWPSIGYHYVIEPDGTIKWCNDIETRAYHVGDHNNYAVGICLTGDFRTEKPTAAQEESLRNLVNGLKKTYSHLKYVKGHSEFSGYEWKACPVFDYKKVLADKNNDASVSKPKPPTKPNVSKPQQKRYTSIVDYLNDNNMGSSFNARKDLASRYGIKNYTGTAAQNTKLLNLLQGNKTTDKSKKSIAQMADEVIKGLHGNGRSIRQKSLGVDKATYDKVQAEVNKRLM